MAEVQTWSEESYAGGPLEFCMGLLSRFSGVAADATVSTMPGQAAPWDESANPAAGRALVRASQTLRERVKGVRALAVVGRDGRIEDRVILDPAATPELLSEFATLVRIADRTSQDTGSLDLTETTWSSDGGTVLSRRAGGGRFLLLVGGPSLRTSVARYVLRQAARQTLPPK